jgi:hypothetical protein
LKDHEVIFEDGGGEKPVVFVVDEVGAIGFKFAGEGFAGFAELVALVNALDQLFQADDDGGDVDEEVAPGVGCVRGG